MPRGRAPCARPHASRLRPSAKTGTDLSAPSARSTRSRVLTFDAVRGVAAHRRTDRIDAALDRVARVARSCRSRPSPRRPPRGLLQPPPRSVSPPGRGRCVPSSATSFAPAPITLRALSPVGVMKSDPSGCFTLKMPMIGTSAPTIAARIAEISLDAVGANADRPARSPPPPPSPP